eukprot:g47150.t1
MEAQKDLELGLVEKPVEPDVHHEPKAVRGLGVERAKRRMSGDSLISDEDRKEVVPSEEDYLSPLAQPGEGASLFKDKFVPLTINFQDVELALTIQKGKEKIERRILRGVSGKFTPGKLTAILGASGSGKTSLLNLMVGKIPKIASTMEGAMHVNGHPVPFGKKAVLQRLFGYVQQHDLVLATQTVREAITMAANLKLPATMSQQDKIARVEQVISMLKLDKCADSMVGNSVVKGISGGELKRLAVAMSMIRQPAALFLDEPTSGLDALAAYQIVLLLKELTLSGRTVVATVHQPSSAIFHLFDRVVILAAGRIAYDGPREELVPYFASKGYPCPHFSNPADYLFHDVLNDWNSQEGTDRIEGLVDNWKLRASEFEAENETPVATSPGPDPPTPMDQTAVTVMEKDKLKVIPETKPEKTSRVSKLTRSRTKKNAGDLDLSSGSTMAPFKTQFQQLVRRAWKNQFRNKLIIGGRLGQVVFLSTIMGLLYFQIRNDQTGIQNRQGLLFFICTNTLMGSLMGVLSIFVEEKPVLVREYENQLYRLPAYFLAKLCVELPFRIVLPLFGVTIIYPLVGFQPDASKFFILALTIVIMENAGSALGIFITSFFNEVSMALTVAPALLMPLMIFSGFFTNSDTIPVYLDWIKYISPIFYAFISASKNEFTGLTLHCTESQQIVLGNGQVVCPITQGEQVIDLLGFESKPSIAGCILILASIWLAFTVAAFLGLKRQLRRVE